MVNETLTHRQHTCVSICLPFEQCTLWMTAFGQCPCGKDDSMATEHHQTDSNPAFGRTRRTKTSFALTLLVGFLSPLLTLNPAKADAGFERWKSDFAKTAVQKGIKRSTFRAAFSGVYSFLSSACAIIIKSQSFDKQLSISETVISLF